MMDTQEQILRHVWLKFGIVAEFLAALTVLLLVFGMLRHDSAMIGSSGVTAFFALWMAASAISASQDYRKVEDNGKTTD